MGNSLSLKEYTIDKLVGGKLHYSCKIFKHAVHLLINTILRREMRGYYIDFYAPQVAPLKKGVVHKFVAMIYPHYL